MALNDIFLLVCLTQ